MPPHHLGTRSVPLSELLEPEHLSLSQIRHGLLAVALTSGHARKPGPDEQQPRRPVPLLHDQRLRRELLSRLSLTMSTKVTMPIEIAVRFEYGCLGHLLDQFRRQVG